MRRKKGRSERGRRKGGGEGVSVPRFLQASRWNTTTRFEHEGSWGGTVAVLYERASHKLSQLFKKLEKGARSLVKQLASRVA